MLACDLLLVIAQIGLLDRSYDRPVVTDRAATPAARCLNVGSGATRIASMSTFHASLTDIPVAAVDHTDAKWTPVRNHFGITAFGVNAYTARNAGDRLIGEHDHADPADEQHQELYFVHTGHARFQVDGQDVDAPAGTFVSALDVKTIRSAVALSDNTVVLVIGAEPGAPFEVTPAERAELAAAGLPATPALP